MSTMCGATGCLDGLAQVLCVPGDIAITPTPVYARIQADFLHLANVEVEPLELLDEVSRCSRPCVARRNFTECVHASDFFVAPNLQGYFLSISIYVVIFLE